jgi:hypothetical protein
VFDGARSLLSELDRVTAVVAQFDSVTAIVAQFDSVTAIAVAEQRAEGGSFSVSRSDELESDKPSEAKCPQNEQRRSQRCIHWFLLNQMCRSVRM